MNATQTKMLRARQVADVYAVGLSSVWALVKAGKLKVYRPSKGTSLFKIDELNAYFLGENSTQSQNTQGATNAN